MIGRSAWISVTLLLAACGSSPPTHYYRLSAVDAPQRPTSTTTPVQVAAVHLPPSLDRLERVVQNGPNSVTVSDKERWSAPLAEMTRGVLSQDLTARLSAGAVVMPDAPAPAGTRQIVVSIARFGSDGAGEVALAGDWSLLKSGTDQVLARHPIALQTHAGDDANSQVAAMSDLLGQLATRIAADLPARG